MIRWHLWLCGICGYVASVVMWHLWLRGVTIIRWCLVLLWLGRVTGVRWCHCS